MANRMAIYTVKTASLVRFYCVCCLLVSYAFLSLSRFLACVRAQFLHQISKQTKKTRLSRRTQMVQHHHHFRAHTKNPWSHQHTYIHNTYIATNLCVYAVQQLFCNLNVCKRQSSSFTNHTTHKRTTHNLPNITYIYI